MERNATFATMVNTGEKPDAEIHMAGFEQEDGIQILGEQRGNGRAMAQIAAHSAACLVKTLQERDSAMAAAAFIMAVNDEMRKEANEETLKCMSTFMMHELEMKFSHLKDEDEDEEEDE